MDYKALKAELLTKSSDELQAIANRVRFNERDFDMVSNNGNGWIHYNTDKAAQEQYRAMWRHNQERFYAAEILLGNVDLL